MIDTTSAPPPTQPPTQFAPLPSGPAPSMHVSSVVSRRDAVSLVSPAPGPDLYMDADWKGCDLAGGEGIAPKNACRGRASNRCGWHPYVYAPPLSMTTKRCYRASGAQGRFKAWSPLRQVVRHCWPKQHGSRARPPVVRAARHTLRARWRPPRR
jgi:hypothetical protein